jgi:hypothetical protein
MSGEYLYAERLQSQTLCRMQGSVRFRHVYGEL